MNEKKGRDDRDKNSIVLVGRGGRFVARCLYISFSSMTYFAMGLT